MGVESERRVEFSRRLGCACGFFRRAGKPCFTAGKDARRYSRAETTPRPAHRIEREAADARARAEGVIGKERDCVRSRSRRIKRRGDFLFCGRCGIDAGYGGSGLAADATVGICERFRQRGDGRFGLLTKFA